MELRNSFVKRPVRLFFSLLAGALALLSLAGFTTKPNDDGIGLDLDEIDFSGDIRTGPKVVNVTSSTADGLYDAFINISIQVTFDQDVTVTGTPQLALETGSTDRTVDYDSGSGTSTLTFVYRTQLDDESADLDYKATNSLTLNDGTIQNSGSVDADLTLPSPGATGSLGANKALVIDGIEPTITNITSTATNGTYGIGDVIPIVVTFSEEIENTDTDGITLETGTSDIGIFSPTISGNQLTFDYTVESGHSSSDLNVKRYDLDLGSDLAGNPISSTLPSGENLADNKNIVIDTSPQITNVTSSTADGLYDAFINISIQITFDQDVTVTGTPQLELETGSADQKADYSSGSGSNELTFTYTVQEGDESSDLDYKATTSLTLNGGTIQNSGIQDANLTLPSPGATGSLGANKALVIDGIEPTITNITSTATNGTYGIGDVIPIVVTFREEIENTDTDGITLETGTSDIGIFSPTISGNQLTFDYTVESGHSSSDLNVKRYDLDLGSDLAGNPISSTLPSGENLADNKNIVIDTQVPSFTSGTTENFEENGTGTVHTVAATDDAGVSYSLGSGNDEGFFDINAGTGAVTFKTAPDFENPSDGNANNDYVVNVVATDAAGNSANQDVTITVTDRVDEVAPFINSDVRVGLNPNANQVDITFNEGVFGGSGSGPVELNDFTLALTNNTTLDTPVITSITNTSDGALVGGETTLRVNFDYNGTAEGDESLTFTPVADAIFDAAGNAASTTQTHGTLELHDETAPTVTITSGLDNRDHFFDLVFSEGIIGLEVADFTASFSVSQTEITLATANVVTDGSSITSLRLNTSFFLGRGAENNTITLNLLENSMVDRAGNAVAATSFTSTEKVDKEIPGLIIFGIDANHTQITGQFTEATYGNNTASAPVEPSDLTLSMSGGTATGASITSITNATGGALVGGEQDILINIAFTNTPNGSETITVEAADNASIFDLPGNFMPTPQGGGNTVTLNDIYAPVFTSGTSASFVENGTGVVYTATATDLNEFTFKLGSNKDEALFAIGKSTGELTFVSSPDFENPQDGDGNNDYEVEITASDRSNISTQTITVTVTDVDDTPPTVASFTLDDTALIPGETAIFTLVFDEAVTGLTSGDFTVPNGGITEPASVDGGITYTATYTPNAEIEDASNEIILDLTGIQDIAGNAGVGTVKTDNFTLDSRTPTVDFALTSSNGLESVSSANLEVGLALESGLDVTVDYTVLGTATGSGNDYTLADGTLTIFAGNTSLDIIIANIVNDIVAEEDETIVVTLSNPTNAVLGTNTVHTYTINDNDAATLAIGDVTQVEGNAGTTIINIPVTLTGQVQDGFTVDVDALLSGDADGADASDVSVSADPTIASATLTFAGSHGEVQNLQITLNGDELVENDETFQASLGNVQANGKNVTIADGDATITITNDDTAPVFTSGESVSVAENNVATGYTATATDGDNGILSFSLVAGNDAGKFSINANSGVLSFNSAPDFENPGDGNSDNIYQLTIKVSDGANEVSKELTVTVTNIDDEAPNFTSGSTVRFAENKTGTVYTATATDADSQTITYRLSNGHATDVSGLFNLDGNSGELSFITSPDFENPGGNEEGGVEYEIVIIASDESGNETDLELTIFLEDVNEAADFISDPILTINDDETYEYLGLISDPDDLKVFNSLNSVEASQLPSWLKFETFLSSNSDLSLTGATGDQEVDINEISSAEQMVRDSQGNAILILPSGPDSYVLWKVTPEGSVSEINLTTTLGEEGEEREVVFELAEVSAMAIDGADNIYLAEVDEESYLFKITPLGQVSEVKTNPNDNELPNVPVDMAFNTEGTELFMADNQGRIDVLNLATNQVNTVSSESEGEAEKVLMAINSGNSLYVYQRDRDVTALYKYEHDGEEYTRTLVLDDEDFDSEESENRVDQLEIFENISDMLFDANDQLQIASDDLILTLNPDNSSFEYAGSFELLEAIFDVGDGVISREDILLKGLELLAESNGLINYLYDGGLGVWTEAQENNTFIETEEPLDIAAVDREFELASNGPGNELNITDLTRISSMASNDDGYLLIVDEGTLLIMKGDQFIPLEDDLMDEDDPENTIPISRGTNIEVFGISPDGDFIVGINSLVILITSEHLDAYISGEELDVRNSLEYTMLTDQADREIISAAISIENELFLNINEDELIKIELSNGQESTVLEATDEFFSDAEEPFFVDIVTDASGKLYITDPENGRILKLDANGDLTQHALLSEVYSLAVSDNNLYAASESGLYLVKSDGSLIALAGDGLGANEEDTFDEIYFIRMSVAEGLIYIIDNQVLKQAQFNRVAFKLSGNAQGQVGAHQVTLLVKDDTFTEELLTGSQSFEITVVDVTAPVITSLSEANANENTTEAIHTVTAEDTDPNAVLSYQLSGTDASLFTIDPSNQEVKFVRSPDFESPTDDGTDNVYNFTITVTDGANNATSREFTLTVTDLNDESPVFTSANKVAIDENTTSVVTLTATDADANSTLSFSITGGADQSLFALAGADLSLQTAEDFENLTQADQTYEVEVTVTDGTNATQQSITVTINDLDDETPVFTSASAVTVDENATSVITLSATDADASSTLSFSITGGADQSLFTLAGADLSLQSAEDFENPTQADQTYEVEVTVTDGTNSAQQSITVTINDLDDEVAVFTSASAVTVDENVTSVTTLTATDADASSTLSFSITGGTDQALFALNGAALSLVSAEDFENPTQADQTYEVEVTVTDGTNSAQQSITVTINDLDDEVAVFTSASEVSLDENTTSVITLTATDADAASTLSFSITGGADQSLFALAGADLSLQSAEDFENPTQSDQTYEVEVTVTDGTNATQQTITVTINDLDDEAPVFTSANVVSINENTTPVVALTATDADAASTLSFSITGGADQALFALNGAALSLVSAEDFENPTQSDQSYEVEVTATDGTNATQQAITVSINDLDDESPVFTSASTVTVDENVTSVTTLTATDADASSTLSFSITGGTDQGLFTLNGADLSLLTAEDFENPTQSDQTYEVEVTVTDGTNATQQAITVSINDLDDESPVFTSASAVTVDENVTSVTTLTATDADAESKLKFSITGGVDQSLFSLSGADLSLLTAEDFENPSQADRTYEVEVTVTDGTNATQQSITVSINDLDDEAPVFTSASAVTVDENATSVVTLTATDVDANSTLSFSITGGADQSLFALAGADLSLQSAEDFEKPTQADQDYEVEVTVTDGTNATQQSITVSIDDLNDETPVFTSANVVAIDENATSVVTLTATDADASSTLSFSITGGADQSLFALAGAGLSLLAAEDFENPTQLDQTYEVEVTVTDGTNPTQQTITVTINDLDDEAPVFTSSSEVRVDENATSIITLTATDADASSTLSFSITGGADQSLFELAGADLSLLAAEDFDNPTQSDQTYELEVTVTDGTNATQQSITVSINDLNDESPVFTSANVVAIDENTTPVVTLTATDADASSTLSFSITGGADQSLFALAGADLSLQSAEDFENPTQVDQTYEVEVTVTDGTNSAQQTITVSIKDLDDEAPVFTSSSAVTVDENTTAIITLTATDADAASTLSFSITGGADQALFALNGAALSLITAEDFENPTQQDQTYEVEVTVTDGTNVTQQTITVTINDLNDETPVFTSANVVAIDENVTSVVTLNGTDADASSTLSFSITGGADQALFALNGAALSLITAEDFENPTQQDQTYEVEVTVTDGTNATQQTITVTINDLNDETPVFTSANVVAIDENVTSVVTLNGTDADASSTLSFSITGGADQALFALNGAALSLVSAEDFENPTQSDQSYEVEVTVTDGTNATQQSITVSINDLDDEAPVFTSASAVTVDENATSVVTLTATDVDANSTLSFSITGGVDQALFVLNGAALSLVSAEDFENPTQADQTYEVEVTATDGTNATQQSITVTINDLDDESPVFTSASAVTVGENATSVIMLSATDADAASTLSFSITGGADQALFALNGAALSLVSAEDFEKPTQTDQTYEVEVTVTDGTNATQQSITVTINDLNDEAPVFTLASAVTVDENATSVITLTATDTDANSTLSFSITGGSDRSLFVLNGVDLGLQSAEDFENPTRADQTYEVEVTVTDGTNATQQSITVTINDLNDESPVFTSSNSISVDENTTSVITLSATDSDASSTLSFSITGGADQSLFALAGADLSLQSAEDFENPTQADQTYEVELTVTDGTNSAQQTITVTINDLDDETPVFTSANVVSIDENATSVITLSAIDADASSTLSFSITGGADQGLFALAGADLNLLAAEDFENPTQADQTYEVEVTVTDGTNSVQQSITVSINDQDDEAPVFTSSNSISVDENTTSVITLSANDSDASSTLSFSITGGADQSLFALAGADLSLQSAEDFENPTQSDQTYEVEVTVTDGTNSDVQTISIMVTDINEAPTSIELDNVTVAENQAAGALVGNLSAMDVDANDSHSYTLVTGEGDTDNAIFQLDGNQLLTTQELDFEQQPVYSIRVATEDGGGLTFEQILQVNVTDVAEALLRVSGEPEIEPTALGLTNSFELTLHNDGDADLEITSITYPEGFSGPASGVTIVPSGSEVITITFAPTEERTYSGDIIITSNGGTVSVAVSADGEVVTSVDDPVLNVNKVRVYPNPARNQLSIDLSALPGKTVEINLYDLAGVGRLSTKAINEPLISLDISDFREGMYLLHISDGEKRVQKKVLIKR